MQPISFNALHLLEFLETSATQANKQAGGVAKTWLLKIAKAIEPRTVEVRITNVCVRVYVGFSVLRRILLSIYYCTTIDCSVRELLLYYKNSLISFESDYSSKSAIYSN